MTSVAFPDSGEICTLEYDANGNMTAKVCPGGNTFYTWDAQDRLVAIDGPGVVASFRYDALGRRVERMVNGETTGYLYDGVQAIAEYGAEDAALLTGLAIDEALGRFAGSGDLTLLTDALGSVVAEARGDEGVATRYGYSPYGETVLEGEGSGSSTRYTGREDDGTGMYFYRARYYLQQLKRFSASDPLGIYGGINVYAYVGGDPVNRSDPTGEKYKPQKPGCDLILDFTETPCRRRCCDIHDTCYTIHKCDAKSLLNNNNPACDLCSEEVLKCFERCNPNNRCFVLREFRF